MNEIQSNIAYYNRKKQKTTALDKRLLLGAFYKEYSEDMQSDIVRAQEEAEKQLQANGEA